MRRRAARATLRAPRRSPAPSTAPPLLRSARARALRGRRARRRARGAEHSRGPLSADKAIATSEPRHYAPRVMAEPRIKLYSDDHWISPYVFSVFVALEEKQVEFEVVPVSLNEKEHTKAAYVERTITARVPALDDGGFVLAESSA